MNPQTQQADAGENNMGARHSRAVEPSVRAVEPPARAAEPPAEVILHLDERKLPAEVADNYVRSLHLSKKERARRAEAAFFAFGKPGREPKTAGNIIAALAKSGDWTPHLKTAQLSTQWNEIVGEAIARHTRVESFRDGTLTIRADSTVWLTQLQYMLPQMKKVIAQHLAPVEVKDVVLRGPNSYTFKRGRYSVPGRGPRDTWG